MIVNKHVNQIDRSGGIERVQGTIAVSSKSFRVISDGLYKNKPQTIIRELCCNALDSHVVAANEGLLPANHPFDLHLPTALSPHLEVRDYGVGMTPEFMMGTFAQFFNSTKTETNDQIGAMGLGSKSPLSYVESFVIKCWDGNTENTYVVFWNEQDLPEINRLAAVPSTEPRGVSVKLDVQSRDLNAFSEAAVKQLKFFPIKPNLTGAKVAFPETKAEFSGKKWQVCKGPNTHSRPLSQGSINAILGPVAYSVELESLPDLTPVERGIFKFDNFNMLFDIGELDVIASREGLSYTKKTNQAIRQVFANFIGEIKTNLSNKIRVAKNKYEARQIYRNICESFPRNFVQTLVLKYKGVNLSDLDKETFVFGCNSKHYLDHYAAHYKDVPLIAGKLTTYSNEGSRVVRSQPNDGQQFYVESIDTHESYRNLVYNDGVLTAADTDRRCRAYARQLDMSLARNSSQISTVYLLSCTADNLKLIQDMVDNGQQIKKVSELEKVELVKRDKTAVSRETFPNLWNEVKRFRGSNETQPFEFDHDAGGVYIAREGQTVFWGDDKLTVQELLSMMSSALGQFRDKPVAMVSKTRLAEFKANTKCVTLYKYVRDHYLNMFKTGDAELQAYMMCAEWSNKSDWNSKSTINFDSALVTRAEQLPESLLKTRMVEASALRKHGNNYNYQKKHQNVFARDWENFAKYKWLEQAGLNRLATMNSELSAKYPLINVITNGLSNYNSVSKEVMEDAVRYIKLVENIK